MLESYGRFLLYCFQIIVICEVRFDFIKAKVWDLSQNVLNAHYASILKFFYNWALRGFQPKSKLLNVGGYD